jgi:glycine cleavage system H protein
MSNPSELKYAATHEWVRQEENGELTVGITDHAQDQLGDLVFVELPEVGKRFEAAAACMLLESVKAASDIYMPVAGEIVAVNSALEDEPEQVNEGPFSGGWLFRLKPDAIEDSEDLLTSKDYELTLDD